ncbi:hypothetical protein B0T17DRAFT_312008 [Bombardia bombarda]|uniref:Secreted protein n=1 Tax=Bombardia bombarda TaxID=252184 RepID=A0AA40BY42_9PEZI|nr:hypothetical protein B0T17DRAFT_312008 [Bombardia bombarda]
MSARIFLVFTFPILPIPVSNTGRSLRLSPNCTTCRSISLLGIACHVADIFSLEQDEASSPIDSQPHFVRPHATTPSHHHQHHHQ